MTITVRRVSHELGHQNGLTTLEQRFLFEGGSVDADAIAGVLWTAPLTGDNSIFGNRPGQEGERTDRTRSLRGFSPVTGFRFDVDMTQYEATTFTVAFSQPDRTTPYLQGGLLWSIRDAASGAVFDEQVNTAEALQSIDQPLGGPKASIRRWLFFRVGHKQVMQGATNNIASILSHH